MSPRKPRGESWESFTDRQIREARERGDFDDLPGAGEPLPGLERPHDELWWVRKKLREEKLSYLPPTLQIRKDLDDARQRISQARTEREVRDIVADINERVRQVNRTATEGPPSSVMPLNVERTVAEWRDRRRGTGNGARADGDEEPRNGMAAS